MTSAKICFILCILASAEAAGNWTDGWVCAFGSTCNNCVNNASWWGEKVFTACGTQPSYLQNCSVPDSETAIADNACKCGEAAKVCGIGHFCYDNTCNRVEKSGACTIDTVKPVPTDCTCAGSFIKNLIGTEADCTVGQFCYNSICNAAAVPAAKEEEEGWSTTQWVLLGCGIAVGLGLLALVAAFVMGCFSSKKRGLNKSSKKSRAVAPAPVDEEALPLVAQPMTYAAPQYNYAAQPMTYIQQAPTYAAPTYAAPQAYAPQYMQAPVPTFAEPVAQYAYQQ